MLYSPDPDQIIAYFIKAYDYEDGGKNKIKRRTIKFSTLVLSLHFPPSSVDMMPTNRGLFLPFPSRSLSLCNGM